MILLSANNLVKRFGPEPVLDGVSLEVRPGQKVALVGPNGTGKTTLLKILAGQIDADSGTIEVHSTARLEYLEQHPNFAAGRSLWDEAFSALDELAQLGREAERLAAELAATTDAAERARLGQRYDHAQHELHRRDAYHLDHKVERVLDGLGFARSAYTQDVHSLSGGQQNRLLLAKVLLREPHLLLLDEPSNHLDVEATEWLESYLAASSQAILLVSHDRYFLDRVTNHVFELYQGELEAYSGNFTAYWNQKAERLKVQARTFERQQDYIAKTEDFIRRNMAGQKTKQAQDREKKLERLDRVKPPREIIAPPMGFPPAERSGDIVLRVEHLSKGFDRPLFEDLSFDVLRGERWGILGPNGTGKTTLLRALVSQIKPDSGAVFVGAGVKIGYYDQQLKCLDDGEMVVDAIRPTGKEFHEPERRALLARFGLTGDAVFQPVSSLSGGERARAALAQLSAQDANVLVLDEPTNHLDLWACDALERALNEFDGTLVFVSHDRYFLNRVADHLLVVEPGRFRVVDGNYDLYRAQLAERTETREPKKPVAPVEKKPAATKGDRGKRKFPYRKIADIENDIFEQESALVDFETSLVSPDVLRDGRRVRELQEQIETTRNQLAALYEHWEEAHDRGDV